MSSGQGSSVSKLPGSAGFDQGFILTQYLINNAIDNLWIQDFNSDHPTTTGFSLASDDHSFIVKDVSMLSPRVILQPQTDAATARAYVQFRFQQGTIVYTPPAMLQPLISFTPSHNIDRWKLAYLATISPVPLTVGSAKLSELHMNNPGTEHYSFNGFSLRLGQGANVGGSIFQHPEGAYSSFSDGGSSLNGVITATLNLLGPLLEKKVDEWSAAGLLNIGYAAQLPNASSGGTRPSTFVPSSTTCQIHPWFDVVSLQQPCYSLQGNARMNSLCLMQMTENRSVPSLPSSLTSDPANYFPSTPPTLFTQSRVPITTNWKAQADDEDPAHGAALLLDGNPNTFWQTTQGPSPKQYPHQVVIDMGAIYLISGITYLPRQDSILDGTIGAHQLSIAAAPGVWGDVIPEAQFFADHSLKQHVWAPVYARWIRVIADNEAQLKDSPIPWASGADINVLSCALDKSSWSFTADSAAPGNLATNACDRNLQTFWHTPFAPGAISTYPHWFAIDRQGLTPTPLVPVSGLAYLPRQDGTPNGTIGMFQVEQSDDQTKWAPIVNGSWTDDSTAKVVTFPPTSARYIRLVALSEAGDRGPWASAAEVDLLDGSGQISSNASTDFGFFVMSMDNLFTRYLLPKLQFVNYAMQAWVGPPIAEADPPDPGKSTTSTWHPQQFGIGGASSQPDSTSSYYQFSKSTNSGTPRWSWHNEYYFNNFANSNSNIHQYLLADVEADNTIRIAFVPGTSRITVSGGSEMSLHCSWQGGNPVGIEDTLAREFSWSLNLDLTAVSDGGLVINVTRNQPRQDGSYNACSYGLINSWAPIIDTQIQTAMDYLDVVQEALQKDFAGQEKLCFPASGAFFFKNPVLNQSGDLVCSVAYDGNGYAVPDPTAPQRQLHGWSGRPRRPNPFLPQVTKVNRGT